MTLPARLTITRQDGATLFLHDDGRHHATWRFEGDTTLATRGGETRRLPTTRAGLSALAAFVDDGIAGVDPRAPVSHPFSLWIIDALTRSRELSAEILEHDAPVYVAERMRDEGLLVPPILFTPRAIDDRYFTHDLVVSYAARVAVARLDLEGAKRGTRPGKRGRVDTWLAHLSSWMRFYTSDGEPYRSLLRTLPVVTEAIPHTLLKHLASVRLERPQSEAQLACVLARVEAATRFDPFRDHDVTLLMRASDDEISELLHIASMFTVVGDDAPLAARARALGHVLASIHLESRRSLRRVVRTYRQLVLRVGPEIVGAGRRLVKTARPPIALPRAPGVRFLDDVGAILDEAERMQHCAARYVVPAVRGELYLFHVARGGAEATVAVERDGTRFIAGPKNVENAACREAERLFASWGEALERAWRATMSEAEGALDGYTPPSPTRVRDDARASTSGRAEPVLCGGRHHRRLGRPVRMTLPTKDDVTHAATRAALDALVHGRRLEIVHDDPAAHTVVVETYERVVLDGLPASVVGATLALDDA